MADDAYTNLIGKQRRRLVATVLGYAEREVYADLTVEQQQAFRAKVLDAVGVFSDFVLDCVRSASEGQWINEEAVKVLYAVNNKLDGIADLLEEEED